MTSYSVISQRFNDEWMNGSSFSTNPTTVYSVDLKGNVGDVVKFTQTLEISVTVNPNETQTIKYDATADATYGEFTGTGINFMTDGMYVGATLNITWGGGSAVSVTVGLLTGTGYNKLRVTKANLISAGIIDGDIRTDFKFRLTSVPDTLIYKYGLNPNGYVGTNYSSWFDANNQAYYISNLTGVLQNMTRVGLGIKSWDMGSVQAKYDTTVSTYFFQYTVEHIFQIPFYIDGEYENINDGTSPEKFLGTASVTYDNGWFFGGTTLGEYIKAELKGGIGRVGYFNENFNGQTNNYEVQDVVITNSDNSDVLEGTVANTVTFSVKKNNGNWSAGTDKLIIRHAKLPTETEYSNKTTIFGTIWIYDQVAQVEGAGAGAGSAVISACTVTINGDPTLLDVSYVITYDTTEQTLITDTANYLLFVTAGVSPAVGDDRVTIPVDLNQFSKNLDVTGLINSATVTFYEPWEYDSGSIRMVTATGWNGDILGVTCAVLRNTSPTSTISKARFRFLAINSVTGDKFDFKNHEINFPIGKIQTTNVGGTTYQVLNLDTPNSFTMPTDELMNRIVATATVPGSPGATQTYTFKTGIQIPWREWIFNNGVTNELYDSAEDQNNQNYRTSNYSNVDNWEIFPVFEFTMLTTDGVETVYRKMTAESNIYDFDTNGGAYSAVTTYFDEDGNQTNNIYIDQNVQVIIEFTHSSGVITLANIEGYIWIERDGSDQQPWFLHSTLDFTDSSNPLTPSDTLLTGNSQFVEVISINNLITLKCLTNRDNLQDGVNYNIYGRIKNKTIA